MISIAELNVKSSFFQVVCWAHYILQFQSLGFPSISLEHSLVEEKKKNYPKLFFLL